MFNRCAILLGLSLSLISGVRAETILHQHSRPDNGAATEQFGRHVRKANDVNGDEIADYIVTSTNRIYIYSGADSSQIRYHSCIRSSYPSAEGIGDINADGFGDVVVGCNLDGSNNNGMVSVYSGQDGGLLLQMTGSYYQRLGFKVAAAGDVNRDGVPDFIATSQNHRLVRVYSGASGSPLIFTIYGDYSARAAGDVDADGYGDIVSAPGDGSASGNVKIYSGRTSELLYSIAPMIGTALGIANNPDAAGDFNIDGFDDIIYGASLQNGSVAVSGFAVVSGKDGSILMQQKRENTVDFARHVGTAGDIDADGYADVVIEHIADRKLLIYSGRTRNIIESVKFDDSVEAARPELIGDVNGDGLPDLGIGLPGAIGSAVMGAAQIVSFNPENYTGHSGIRPADNLGWSLSAAGDADFDGGADFVVAAPSITFPSQYGRVELISGSGGLIRTFQPVWNMQLFGISLDTSYNVDPSAPLQIAVGALNRVALYEPTYSYPKSIIYGPIEGSDFGASLASVGELDGNVGTEVLIGAPQENAAYLYSGSLNAPMLARLVPGSTSFPVDFGRAVGYAGDLNSDGFPDLMVSDPLSVSDLGAVHFFSGATHQEIFSPLSSNVPNGLFGEAIAPIKELNSSMLSYIAVGAPFEGIGGAVHIFAAHPPFARVAVVQSSNAAEEFGAAIRFAGDVNADGVADIIVGAPAFENGRGRAVVVSGSDWSTQLAEYQGQAPGVQLGRAVSLLGDTDRDGKSEVVVGAPFDDSATLDSGRVFVDQQNGPQPCAKVRTVPGTNGTLDSEGHISKLVVSGCVAPGPNGNGTPIVLKVHGLPDSIGRLLVGHGGQVRPNFWPIAFPGCALGMQSQGSIFIPDGETDWFHFDVQALNHPVPTGTFMFKMQHYNYENLGATGQRLQFFTIDPQVAPAALGICTQTVEIKKD